MNLSAYDQIRKGEGIALGANVGIKHTAYADADHIVKSANFNERRIDVLVGPLDLRDYMRGTVLAESQLGRGSTFTVTLPAVEAEQPA